MPPSHESAGPFSGVSTGRTLHRPSAGTLEWIAVVHAAAAVVGLAWAYGGAAEWMWPWIGLGCGAGFVVTVAAAVAPDPARAERRRTLRWLWPLLAFDVFVLIGTFNPGVREVRFDGEVLLALRDPAVAWLPSSARPALGREALWLFNALFIPAFNIALVVRRRALLRGLLLVAALSTVALAVLGTVQKLTGASGPYFGQATTRQNYYFSTFVYHNHWGAYVLLMLAAGLGLIWHYARRTRTRDALHSPALSGLTALLLVAITVPLSGSRSSTLLGGALLLLAFVVWAAGVVRRRRGRSASPVPILVAGMLAVAVGLGAVWFVARDTIRTRLELTRTQVGHMRAIGGIGGRAVLYRDTWKMAADRPVFGWGMASYPHVFLRYNSQTSPDKLPIFYRDAHSDWLQALSEHGFLGSALLALCAVVPAAGLRRWQLQSAVPVSLFAGCAAVLVYAWVEFPFGNFCVIFTWWLCFFCAVQYARLQERDPASRQATDRPA